MEVIRRKVRIYVDREEKKGSVEDLHIIHSNHLEDLEKGARFSRGDLENIIVSDWGLRLRRMILSPGDFDIKRINFLKSLGVRGNALNVQVEISFYYDKVKMTPSQATELLLKKCRANKRLGKLDGLDLFVKNPKVLTTFIDTRFGIGGNNSAIISLDITY